MAGIILESAIVLVPLGCAAIYIIVSSNKLLFIFSVCAITVGLAAMRLRYHYSSGAHGNLVVRIKESAQPSTDAATAAAGDTPSAKKTLAQDQAQKKNLLTAGETQVHDSDSDSEAGEFDEIVQDAHRHCDIDDEVVDGSGALLSQAVTTDSTKYDVGLYGSALSYDHRCFYINGRPMWVLAADFDYWRVVLPADCADKQQLSASERVDQAKKAWRRVLQQYKAVGFNAVRIRFHWGFHSPSKGKYDFTGIRDVHQLLTLCEEMGILVIACLGPFIGDDVQGGGYPFWLIQRDHIRLRHLLRSGVKVWDNRFAAAEAEWYDHIISMIVSHEVVTKNVRGRGCVVLVQLENKLEARGPLGLPLALQDETRLLARMARERVIRTPLVTNNHQWPADFSSFAAKMWARVEKKLQSYRIIGSVYCTDLVGFTVRDITSTPVEIDSVARITRGDNAPMLALELYKPTEGGSSFSEQIEAALSQGLSALSLPGFFGLANWGNFASPSLTAFPETSNKYAAVSEDGALSTDARAARLVLHIARAFELQGAASDFVNSRPWIMRTALPAVRGVSFNKLPPSAVRVRRQWEYAEGASSNDTTAGSSGKSESSRQLGIVTYVDGSSLPALTATNPEDSELAFMFTLADAPTLNKGTSFALTGTLGPRKRGIFVSNIFVGTEAAADSDPLLLVTASKEIYARIVLDQRSEVWVCAEESVQSGQFFFHEECRVSGHAEVEVVDVEHAKGQKFSFVIPKSGPGVATVISPSGVSVHIVLLTQQALDTLVVDYCSYDRSTKALGAQTAAAWGADGIVLQSAGDHIELALSCSSAFQGVSVISPRQPQASAGALTVLPAAETDAVYGGHPFLWQFAVDLSSQNDSSTSVLSSVNGFEKRTTNWETLPWKLLPTMADLETMDEINLMSWQRDLGMFAYNAIDIGFSASHVLYRCQVRLKPQHITSPKILLQINARHRCTVWVNGVSMSGHETFHEQNSPRGTFSAWKEALKNPGASCGPDRWSGTHTYDVTSAMRISQPPNATSGSSAPTEEEEEGALNEVMIAVESYGLGTQSDGLNDARVPRGIIAAYWHGFNLIGEDHDDSEIHDHSHDHRTEQLRTKWEICGVDVTLLPNSYNSSGFPDEKATSGWAAAVEYPLMQDGWSTRVKVNVDAGVHWLRWQLLPPTEQSGEDGIVEPVFLNISGRVTAYVWVNGVLLTKHRVGETNLASAVLLRGGALAGIRASANTEDNVVVMLYGWAEHSDITAENSRLISVDISLTNKCNA
ncbi:hypothetical protein GGF37_001975 [Kickxella alabastrina]|nr:hypothetical protein GGF37_001975 [Kickxella alabastrina]